MKSFGAYISKHLASFMGFILVVVFLNVIVFGSVFYNTFREDYGDTAPRSMLEMTAAASTTTGVSEDVAQMLKENNIWVIYLRPDGQSYWTFDLPEEVPESYTIQGVALFSKGYIEDYPVFVWNTEDGLLVLGYPKDSYTKLTSNYYPIQLIKKLPVFITGILAMDLLLLFAGYYFSKRKIIKNTEPIIAAVGTLADGKPISLHVHGELSEMAESVNKASLILSKQNESRANWISGVSHDIRTPLSMIMGYADRISMDDSANGMIQEQAGIIRQQSIKIKELVQDLNLVSQLEYDMQPLHKEPVRLSKLIRSYAAELLNANISEAHTVEVDIAPDAETVMLECDARLITRAINNLVQNSIQHNPRGCEIKLSLDCSADSVSLAVEDNGCGLSIERIKELEQKPHYMNSTDKGLNLRHGLGLLIVRQIVEAHNGSVMLTGVENQGCRIEITFPAS
ncbi:MAG: HAMP domain-containing histidine kinase [Oscillospiraceae bacterium]|nr:HAMP domain-containing histidine kinase [Oscillospiraceae bacterium]